MQYLFLESLIFYNTDSKVRKIDRLFVIENYNSQKTID